MNYGVDGVTSTVQALADKMARDGDVERAVHAVLSTVALDLQGKAQRLAPKAPNRKRGKRGGLPHRGGTLRGSAFHKVSVNIHDPYAIVGFSTPYAMRQHEELGYRHTDGQAKYLEGPLWDNGRKYLQFIAAAVKKVC